MVGFGENQLIVVSWQAVINNHVHPVSIAPELHRSIKHSAILRLPVANVSLPHVPFVHTILGLEKVNLSLSGLWALWGQEVCYKPLCLFPTVQLSTGDGRYSVCIWGLEIFLLLCRSGEDLGISIISYLSWFLYAVRAEKHWSRRRWRIIYVLLDDK